MKFTAPGSLPGCLQQVRMLAEVDSMVNRHQSLEQGKYHWSPPPCLPPFVSSLLMACVLTLDSKKLLRRIFD